MLTSLTIYWIHTLSRLSYRHFSRRENQQLMLFRFYQETTTSRCDPRWLARGSFGENHWRSIYINYSQTNLFPCILWWHSLRFPTTKSSLGTRNKQEY